MTSRRRRSRRPSGSSAIGLAIEAGTDLLLVANLQDYDPGVVTRVVDAVERPIGEGQVTESRIDASVGRIERLFPSG